MKKSKKYNPQTGGYKIDVFYEGKYQYSTDWYKTCKEAVQKDIKNYSNPKKLKAYFDYGKDI